MTQEQVDQIVRALRFISMGEESPAGLEGLAISIAGNGLASNLCDSIIHLANANIEAAETIADGLNNIALAISESKK